MLVVHGAYAFLKDSPWASSYGRPRGEPVQPKSRCKEIACTMIVITTSWCKISIATLPGRSSVDCLHYSMLDHSDNLDSRTCSLPRLVAEKPRQARTRNSPLPTATKLREGRSSWSLRRGRHNACLAYPFPILGRIAGRRKFRISSPVKEDKHCRAGKKCLEIPRRGEE